MKKSSNLVNKSISKEKLNLREEKANAIKALEKSVTKNNNSSMYLKKNDLLSKIKAADHKLYENNRKLSYDNKPKIV